MTDPAMAMNEAGHERELASGEARGGGGWRPISFGQCQAFPASRKLLRQGRPVDLGSRAFDLLIVLLQSRGELVSKDDIMRHVWPSTMVEESNLRFQMATLRKAIGEDRELIKTIPGRGYLLIAEDEAGGPAADIGPVTGDVLDTTKRLAGSAIFIVEGDRDIRDALQRLLRPFNAQVLSFGSVEALMASNARTHRNASSEHALF